MLDKKPFDAKVYTLVTIFPQQSVMQIRQQQNKRLYSKYIEWTY